MGVGSEFRFLWRQQTKTRLCCLSYANLGLTYISPERAYARQKQSFISHARRHSLIAIGFSGLAYVGRHGAAQYDFRHETSAGILGS